jgi:hypothetical protein
MEPSGGAGVPLGPAGRAERVARWFSEERLEPDLPAERPPGVAGLLLWAAGFPPRVADVPSWVRAFHQVRQAFRQGWRPFRRGRRGFRRG